MTSSYGVVSSVAVSSSVPPPYQDATLGATSFSGMGGTAPSSATLAATTNTVGVGGGVASGGMFQEQNQPASYPVGPNSTRRTPDLKAAM